jgi:hypothetical protein
MERSVRAECLNGVWIGAVAEEDVDHLARFVEVTKRIRLIDRVKKNIQKE